MPEVGFYHLLHMPLERALPKLLEKALERGHRAIVLAGSKERVEDLNVALWTYEERSWLPHGTAKDGNPEDQPIWLSTEPESANKATFLFLTDGATSDWVDSFERCFELFDGRDADAVQAARGRWKSYKDAGHELSYLQQTPQGGWEKKA